jgi:hypothetical protein
MTYEKTIAILIIVGTLASSAYVLTWTPSAVKARLRGHTSLTAWEIVDFAAVPALLWVIFVLSTINMIRKGVAPATDPGLAVQRLVTSVFLVAIVILRLVRWILKWRSTPKEERGFGASLTGDPAKRSS